MDYVGGLAKMVLELTKRVAALEAASYPLNQYPETKAIPAIEKD